MRAHLRRRYGHARGEKLTAAMWRELELTLAAEDNGQAGREGRWFKQGTLGALRRRGLVEFHITAYRLTPAGRKVLGR